MPSQVALWLGYAFCFFLFRADMKWRIPVSRAMWIPGLWLAMLSSRPASFWIGGGGTSNAEGSPVNLICNGGLIFAAIIVLAQRKLDWGHFLTANKALLLLYGYYALSAMWSEFPLPTIKRLVNNFGLVLVAMVILTEKNPMQSLRTVYVRVAYVLLPLSIVLIRYVPRLGRVYSKSGEPMAVGVTDHKNSLGAICVVLGLVIFWDILENWKGENGPKTKSTRYAYLSVCLIGLYLLILAGSATAMFCFTVGAVVLLIGKRLAGNQNAGRLVVRGIVCVGLVMVLESTLNISDTIFQALGRNSSMTGRTEIWKAVGEARVNELIGSGYRGFWESAAGEAVNDKLNMNRMLTAHNGYLETYLNGGIVGVFLLVIFLLKAGGTAVLRLAKGHPLGSVALAYWVVSLFLNTSESDFFILSPLFFTLLLVTTDCRTRLPNMVVGRTPIDFQASRGHRGPLRVT